VIVATDIGEIVSELVRFYDFTGKTVIEVGAGGGQLIEYARPARRVIAVDRDAAALARLEMLVADRGWTDRFTLVAADFAGLQSRGDVVLFEFCLHEMPAPDAMLAQALDLAPEVLVIDHAPGSPWSWYAGEDGGVEGAWAAVERRGVHRRRDVEAWQQFRDFDELAGKLVSQVPECQTRIASFRGQRDIAIPMPYRIAVLT
jgi:SAM-dependent methyltransferase